MPQRNEIALLLAGIGLGAIAGALLGLLVLAVVPSAGSVPFFLVVFGSYIGMLIADRRRLALRRAAAAQTTSPAAPPKRAAKGRQTRR
jgi:hypothetical protein